MYLDVPDETTIHSTALPLAGPSPTTTTAAPAPVPVYDPSAGFGGAVGGLSVPELAPAPAPAVAVAEQADLLDLYNIASPMKDTR